MDMNLSDPAVFARVYDEHVRGVRGAAFRILNNAALAQDVAQDVFIRVWRAPPKLDARRGGNLGLHEALAHLSAPRFADVELNVDVKHVGIETELLRALRHAGLLHRTLISSQVPMVVSRIRALDPPHRASRSRPGASHRNGSRRRRGCTSRPGPAPAPA